MDYVEGRWNRKGHEDLVDLALAEYSGQFTNEEVILLKTGAVLPDQLVPSGTVNPGWHGNKDHNYIANYIFATKIAKSGGNTSSLAKAKGQDTDCFENMKSTVTLSYIYDRIYTGKDKYDSSKEIFRQGHYWPYLIKEKTGLDYASQSASTQKRLNHDNGADSISIAQNRFYAAGHTAKKIVKNYLTNSVGDIRDFTAYGETCWNGFHLGNILDYALQANNGYDTADVKKWFKGVNYTFK